MSSNIPKNNMLVMSGKIKNKTNKQKSLTNKTKTKTTITKPTNKQKQATKNHPKIRLYLCVLLINEKWFWKISQFIPFSFFYFPPVPKTVVGTFISLLLLIWPLQMTELRYFYSLFKKSAMCVYWVSVARFW